jgi:hypothetical protein
VYRLKLTHETWTLLYIDCEGNYASCKGEESMTNKPPYLLGEMIGEGGFGSVFAGIHLGFGVPVEIQYPWVTDEMIRRQIFLSMFCEIK